MARYDRIARIAPPERDQAFHGWLTLRDLDGREREPELGRRARLHYLALRPLRRLLVRGLDGPDADSVERQIQAVRKQVQQLPFDDPARDRLDDYLKEVGGRSPEGLVRAALDVGAAAEAGGHRFAAEEFYRTGLDLARSQQLSHLAVVALRLIGRVLRDRQEFDQAVAAMEESAALADALDAPVDRARSLEALAAVHLRRGRPDEARATLNRITTGAAGESGEAAAIAAAGLCALELASGRPDAALEAGWNAIKSLPARDEVRNGVLLNMGAAFRRLGLHEAAASAYAIVMRWAAWPEHRIEAALEHAAVAAESDDPVAFAERREALLERLSLADRPLQALVDLGLGRGALLVGDDNLARDHLRSAIATARDIGDPEILDRSDELLSALESRSRPAGGEMADPSPDAHRIARAMESLVAREPQVV